MLLKTIGFCLAKTPDNFLAAIAMAGGHALVAVPNPRRRILLSNLKQAFPEWPEKHILRVARQSAAGLVEMGLFSLAYPCMSDRRIRQIISFSPEAERKMRELRRSGEPVVVFIPHVALFEALPTSPLFGPGGAKKLGGVYRPHRNPAIEEWVLRARERSGIRMFARDNALIGAKSHLLGNNWLAILFDQNAGNNGTLITFLDRLASATPLPGILAKGTRARAVFALPERKSFFRATLFLKEMKGKDPNALIAESHELMENHLRSSDQACAEWLWAHRRWNTRVHWKRCLRLEAKRQNLPPLEAFPRKTKFWIRLPNWLGDVVMALPLLRVLRAARPDAELTLLCQPQFRPLLELLQIGDAVKTLPAKGTCDYYAQVYRWRRQYPEFQILFTNSLRGDLESYLIGANQRFGLELPMRPRPFLTKTYKPDKETLKHLNTIHQSKRWEKMLMNFGLLSEITTDPFPLSGAKRLPNKFGFIAGSSNNPSKCWAIANWVELGKRILKQNPDNVIHLYGTSADREATDAIAMKLPAAKVKNQAGTTDLQGLAKELATCALVVGNDTGGIHLANAVSTPVAVLCGPTNPIVTGPFFDSPKSCMQPEGCLPEGGALMESLSVDKVINGIKKLMKT